MSSGKKLSAIVTGGAQGLGRAIAETLLNHGYRVCIADVNEAKGHETREELAQKYGSSDIIFVTCDVTQESDYIKVFEKVLQTFERIDLLVNNAGIACEKDYQKTLNVNLNGPILGCKTAFRFMGKDNGGNGGNVINVASLLGLMPFPRAPFYVASKHGVVGLTRSYGTPFYFDKHGIIFNALCPSYVNTEMLKGAKKNAHEDSFIKQEIMEPDFVAKGIIKILDDKRNGGIVTVIKRTGYQYVDLPEALQKYSTILN